MGMKPSWPRSVLLLLGICLATSCTGCAESAGSDPAPPAPTRLAADAADPVAQDMAWQDEFAIAESDLTATGASTYFVLEPGFQTVLASDTATLKITVLDDIKTINGIPTRVVEEKEEANGELFEISRNFFALDRRTGDVFYFGEEVDFYRDGAIVGHSGAWLAYENGNQPGLIMAGRPEIGLRYFQEIAPGVAMDRAEVISLTTTYVTPAGTFDDCLVTRETTPLEPATVETKTYAPGIGLIQDQGLKLVSFGYVDLKNGRE